MELKKYHIIITLILSLRLVLLSGYIISTLNTRKTNNYRLNAVSEAKNSIEDDERLLRFSGVGRLYASDPSPPVNDSIEQEGKPATSHYQILDRLHDATVAIFGLGGVGSWSAEALCRSGVGNLVLVDLDDICISNTNRQLHTLRSSIGKMKIDEMKERLLDINPECNVTLIHDFVSPENAMDIVQSILPNLTACIDAIDGQTEKTALIAACCLQAVPIVTCGGAAGRIDPTKVVCDDLTRVADDRLLFACRKKLRDQYKLFAKGPSNAKEIRKFSPRKWNINAVFSTELQKSVPVENEISSFRKCDGNLGTACFLTGTYGFVAASKVVTMIAHDNLKRPRILPSATFHRNINTLN